MLWDGRERWEKEREHSDILQETCAFSCNNFKREFSECMSPTYKTISEKYTSEILVYYISMRLKLALLEFLPPPPPSFVSFVSGITPVSNDLLGAIFRSALESLKDVGKSAFESESTKRCARNAAINVRFVKRRHFFPLRSTTRSLARVGKSWKCLKSHF